ncbi:hypothetical protein B0H19DRAFT_1189241 [Mycena capillaripes]|nr:hypothetical protein B0H19DRAFT_1189241 [Mycena capillaripes]
MLFFLDTVLSVPFNSILVRYRAASHPKAAVEDGSIPPPPTFISMAKRVWRLQGVEGLTKGLMPTLMATFFFTLMWPFGWFKLYLSPSSPTTTRVGPSSSLIYTLIYTIILVTTYRAIATPRKLDVLNAREALHILFSAHERKKPWVIFQIPGLLPALFLNLGIFHFIVSPLRDLIRPWWLHDYSPLEDVLRNAGLVLLAMLSTIVSAPLEVIVTRLALQRNYGGLTLVDGSEIIVAASETLVDASETRNAGEFAVAAPVAQSPPVVTSPPIPVSVETAPAAQLPAAVETGLLSEEVDYLAENQVENTPTPIPTIPVSVKTTPGETDSLSEKADYPVENPVENPPAPPQFRENVVISSAADGVDLERGLLPVNSDDVVVHLRSENEPYLGLVDCAKRIIAEEGWPVLYRMWFLTFLGNLF